MDLFKILEKLISSNSPVIVIFSLLIIFLFHKFLISPKLDAILQNTEKSKALQDIDKLKEFINDKNNNVNEKMNSIIDDIKKINENITEISVIINTIIKDTSKRYDSIASFNESLSKIYEINKEMSEMVESIYDQAQSCENNSKDTKTIIKTLLRAVNSINELTKKIENIIIEIRATKQDDKEYFELMKKREEIEEQLRKKKESLNVINSKMNGNLFAYINETNLVTDEEIEEILRRKD